MRRNIRGKIFSNSSTLFFNSVTFKDSGYWHCFGQYKKDTKHFWANTFLKVYGELFFFNALFSMSTTKLLKMLDAIICYVKCADT